MNLIEAQKVYKNLAGRPSPYKEEVHCPMVLHLISTKGRISAFCSTAMISEKTFYFWVNKFELFRTCYELAQILARESWEIEYEDNQHNEEWDKKEWVQRGSRYFASDKAKLRLCVDPEADPWVQYRQILKQASEGDFNASEIKQLMESVNIGTRVFEVFKLQTEVDKMKDDLSEMSQRSGHNIVAINKTTATN